MALLETARFSSNPSFLNWPLLFWEVFCSLVLHFGWLVLWPGFVLPSSYEDFGMGLLLVGWGGATFGSDLVCQNSEKPHVLHLSVGWFEMF